MKYHQLTTKANATKHRKGRGISAGRGKTAGRGTKGQNSRSGGRRRPGFEGGQNPLYMRLPKLKGFTSKRRGHQVVKTGELANLAQKNINHMVLAEAGLISRQYSSVKLIKSGKLKTAVNVKVDAASNGAVTEIEAAGGSFTATPAPKRPSDKKSKT